MIDLNQQILDELKSINSKLSILINAMPHTNHGFNAYSKGDNKKKIEDYIQKVRQAATSAHLNLATGDIEIYDRNGNN